MKTVGLAIFTEPDHHRSSSCALIPSSCSRTMANMLAFWYCCWSVSSLDSIRPIFSRRRLALSCNICNCSVVNRLFLSFDDDDDDDDDDEDSAVVVVTVVVVAVASMIAEVVVEPPVVVFFFRSSTSTAVLMRCFARTTTAILLLCWHSSQRKRTRRRHKEEDFFLLACCITLRCEGRGRVLLMNLLVGWSGRSRGCFPGRGDNL